MAKMSMPRPQRRSHGSLPLFPNARASKLPPNPNPPASLASPGGAGTTAASTGTAPGSPGTSSMGAPGPAVMPSASSSPSTYPGVGTLAPSYENTTPPSMKKGGWVHETGIYKLHKGEHVTPARDAYHKKS